MAEDIQIGADTSQAVANIGAISKAFEQAARASQVSSKEMNAALRQQERATGTLVAGIARANSGRAQERRTIQELITAEQKLAAAKRVTANTGVRTNSAGQGISASTGRFVGAAQTSAYEKQVALAERLYQRESDIAEMRQRSAAHAATQARLSQTFSTPARSAGSAEVAAYERSASAAQRLADRQADINRQRERGARQQQLETVFARNFYGVADEGAGKLRRVANIINQIPPATWGQKLGAASQAIMGMSNSTRYALYDVSNSFGIAGAALVGFGALGVRAAITHERAFANVRRTTRTTEVGYEHLRLQLERMAATMPVAFEELTNIASAAGQLGISASGVGAFTSTVAKLSATTNLTSDAAGVALARFKAFFAETGRAQGLNVAEQTFSNLASSILKVGVNSIATETGIVNVATQIASMGQYSGMTANQVIGLAGALSSVGVAPELARGSITRTFSLIGTAVSEGGDRLSKFASLAGMSSEEFRKSWGTDKFSGTFQAMMEGLYGVTQGGEDANLMLMELGFNSVRDRPLLLRLAGAANEAGEAGKLLAQTNEDAFAGWTRNSELALQYSKISETTAARIQTLGNAFEQLFASMGKETGGFLGEAAADLTVFVNGLTELSRSPVGQILGTIALNAALVVGALALVGAAGARTAANLQGIGSALTEMRKTGVAATTKLGNAFKVLNLSLGIIGIIGAIAGLVVGLTAMGDASEKAKRGVQDIDGLVGAMKQDFEAGGAAMFTYSAATAASATESKNLKKQAEEMTTALYGNDAAARKASGGLDSVASSAKDVMLAYGDATKAFMRSQLRDSETFQSLFDPSKHWGGLFGSDFGGVRLEDMGFDPADLDWDKFMDESMKGGIDRDKLYKEITDMMGGGTVSLGAEGLVAAKAYANEVVAVMGELPPEIQKAMAATAALGSETQSTVDTITSGYADAATIMGEMDEATQKAVESMAQGFQKFADTGNLIKLTQQGLDKSPEGAKAFEKAWSDAYGGASFKIEEYLTTFRRAAGEQETFVANLQALSVRGLSQGVIAELSAMGPEANRLVQALVDGTDAQLQEYEALWGQTGYDAMVLFAAQTYMAQQLVNDVMQRGGTEAVQTFSNALATGKGVDAALAEVQKMLDADKLEPKSERPKIPNLTWAQKKVWEEQNRLTLTGNVYARVVSVSGGAGLTVRGSGGGKKWDIRPGFADGGWTGAGSKYTEKGVVHADEFVFNKRATNNVGVGNLYALMAQAERGRPAPRGRGKGYANGGLVGGMPGMGTGVTVVALSPEDRALLRSVQPYVRIGTRDIAQAQADVNFVNKRQGVG